METVTYLSPQKLKWVSSESKYGLTIFCVFYYLGIKNNRLNLFQFVNDAKGH